MNFIKMIFHLIYIFPIIAMQIIAPLFELVDNHGRSRPIPLIAYPNTGERFDLELR